MTIDMHAHWLPPQLASKLRTRQSAPLIKADGSGREYLHQPRGAFPLPPNYASLERRLQSMDDNDIGCSVVSVSSVFGIECLDVDESLPLAQTANDGLSQAHSQYPDRLMALATLPIANIETAAREFERSLQLPGIVGALIPGNAFLTLERAEPFRPLFEVAQEHKAHILVHSGLIPNDTSFPPSDDVDNARERRVTLDMQSRISSNMITLCLTDFLDPYPDVTVQCHNLGGNIPYEIDRIDHISLDREPDLPPPSTRIRAAKVMVDCNSMGPNSIELAVSLYGAKRVMYGTDGSDFGAKWSRDAIARANISDDDKDAILFANAAEIIQPKRAAS